MNMQANWRRDALLYLVAAVMALATYWVVVRLHRNSISGFAAVARGTLYGQAQLRAFQNRLLAPALVEALTWTGLKHTLALGLFHFACLVGEVVLVVALLRHLAVPRGLTLLYAASVLFGFLAVQDQYFFVWDAVDLIVFTALAGMAVVQCGRVWPLVALFVVALFNRESALFIALYVALLGLDYDAARGKVTLRDWRVLVLGLGLGVAGVAYTKLVRDLIFIVRGDAGLDASHQLLGNHFMLLTNLSSWTSGLASAGLIAAALILSRIVWPFDAVRLRWLALVAAMTASVLIFADVTETRTLFMLIPFYVFTPVLLEGRAPQGTQTVQL